MFVSNIPVIPGDAEFYKQAQQALARIRQEIDRLRGAPEAPLSNGANGANAPNAPTESPEAKQETVGVEELKQLYETLLRKGDLRDIARLHETITALDRMKKEPTRAAQVALKCSHKE